MIIFNTMKKKDERRFFINICTSHFICKGSKRLCGVLLWEGAGDRTETVIFCPPLLWPSTLCLSLSSGLLNRRPWAHSAGWWLSLQHLISNFSGPQTPSGFPRSPSARCGFPYHISSYSDSNSTATELELNSTVTWLPSWLRYIII